MSNAALKMVGGGGIKKIHFTSSMGFHMGEAFCRVASDYPTVLDVILEQVQNAIDANATKVSVVLNRKTRHIAIRDNGDGVSSETFDSALNLICRSQKQQTKLGRFGIGLISPLDKCHFFTFISCPKGSKQYTEWKFVTDEIRRQEKDVLIEGKLRSDIFFLNSKDKSGPKGQTSVMWRTEVNIVRYSEDKMISRISSIDSLSESILEKFGSAMRRSKVSLDLKFVGENGEQEVREAVRAKQFTGRPLGEKIVEEADVGKVTFHLYLATKTTKGQVGKVIVGESDNDYRFGFNLLSRGAEGFLSPEVRTALLSGIFEGEILGEKVKLHSTRRSFEKDDAFVGFCIAIDTWFLKYGAKHLETVKEENREVRYQELGLKSLREIEEMFRGPGFESFRAIVSGFKLGSVGPGHAARAKNAIAGTQSQSALSTTGTHGAVKEDGDSVGKSKVTETDMPGHLPYTVAGPRGQKRTLVKNSDSAGFQISHISMDGSDKLWEFDSIQGILHFNISHPTFVACDGSDRKIMQLHQTVAIQALTLEGIPDDMREGVRYIFDEALHPLVHLFHKSYAFNPQSKPRPGKG